MTMLNHTEDIMPSNDTQHAFHEGERRMQASVGVAERMAEIGDAVIRDYMPQQHRDFFPLLPFLIVGSVDSNGHPAASTLSGEPGFVNAPDARTLHITAQVAPDDPLHAALRVGAELGLLGIQPHTRRRNRANGIVREVSAHGFTVDIQQSFGNCPKYIQAREPRFVPRSENTPLPAQISRKLTDAATALLRRTDTFFIATSHPQAVSRSHSRAHGVDVSHRGGKPAFIAVDESGALIVPDYSGNRFFNTLGNLLLNPQAGLLVIDYDSGDLLQLAVRGEIVTDADAVLRVPGAERLLRFTVDHATIRPKSLPLSWGPARLSPILENLTR